MNLNLYLTEYSTALYLHKTLLKAFFHTKIPCNYILSTYGKADASSIISTRDLIRTIANCSKA